mmetsp:Transcript_21872/g.33907  ORF Transcript_21872/g.33907 Transcript_21872/m.33907 type:complete len:170 (-) Transcript_21872:177-686(-)
MIMFKSKHYALKYKHDYDFMFIATLGIAASLSLTFVFLTFYSMSEKMHKRLDTLDYMGKLVMIFFYTFAFIASEMVGTKAYFFFMFFLVVILIVNLIMVQYDSGRMASLWATVTIISLIYFYDFIFSSTPKQKEIFYIPMFLELALVGSGYLLYIFRTPEKFCSNNRFT